MKLVRENINEEIKHLAPRSENEIKDNEEKERIENENKYGREETVKGYEKVKKFIKEDITIQKKFKKQLLNALGDLNEKYKDKLWATRMIFNKKCIAQFKEPWCNPGDLYISTIGMRDVGTYWEHSDLPYLKSIFDLHDIEFSYVHDYHYIRIVVRKKPIKEILKNKK